MRYAYKDGRVYTKTSMNIMIEHGHGRYKRNDFKPITRYYEIWSKANDEAWRTTYIFYATIEKANECIAMLERCDDDDKYHGILPEWWESKYEVREVTL